MKFIDVSNHNDYIDWNLVKNDGIEAVIIKATEGTTYKDTFRDIHYEGAKSVGLNIGFYHFLSFTSLPETQAKNFWDEIKDKKFNIKPVLDVETRNSLAEEYCNRFINKFKELSGMDLLMYSYRSFIEEFFSSEFCCNKYWWGAEYDTSIKDVSKCGTWTAWQFTEKGHINGVTGNNGNCDINYIIEPQNFYINNTVNSTVEVNNYNDPDTRVLELQKLCNENYAGLIEDNVFGENTDNAVRNLPLAGIPYKTPSLTTWIQLRLGLYTDGIFGNKTDSAVRKWQSEHGLIVDGIAGYNTIKSLALDK